MPSFLQSMVVNADIYIYLHISTSIDNYIPTKPTTQCGPTLLDVTKALFIIYQHLSDYK